MKTAIGTFIARKVEIDDMLAELVALSEDHFECDPDRINWGDCGSLGFVRDKLGEILAHFDRSTES